MKNPSYRWKTVGIGLISVLIVGLAAMGLLARWHSNSKQTEPVSVETHMLTVDQDSSQETYAGPKTKDPAPIEAMQGNLSAPQIPANASAQPNAIPIDGEEDQTQDVLREARKDQELKLNVVLAEYSHVFTDWIEAPPTDPKEMIQFALQMNEIERFQDAEELLTSIQRLYPDEPAAYQALGEIYKRLGEYDNAITQFSDLRSLSPQDLGPLLQLTEAQIDAGYIDDALIELEDAIADQPQKSDLQLQIIRALDHVNGDQALRLVQDWVSQEPESTDARQILAAQYASSGSSEAALRTLDSLIRSAPDQVNSHIYKAIVAEDLGLMSEAVAVRETTVMLAPQNAAYRVGLAQLYLDENQQAAALDQIQTAIDLMPENSKRETAIEHLVSARQLAEEGQHAEAFEQIQTAIDSMPENRGHEVSFEQLGLAPLFKEK